MDKFDSREIKIFQRKMNHNQNEKLKLKEDFPCIMGKNFHVYHNTNRYVKRQKNPMEISKMFEWDIHRKY